MMISFPCSKCHKRLRVEQSLARKQVRCAFCEAVQTAPEDSPEAKLLPQPREPETDLEPDQTLSKPPMKIDQEELIDMTAMVDIVFFLLIFFLVTSMSTLHSSMPTPVPDLNHEGQAAKSADELESSNDVVVHLHRDDQVDVDGVFIADLSDLTPRLQLLRSKGGATMGLLVMAHAEATHGRAVTILDAAYESGMDRVRMAVSEKE